VNSVPVRAAWPTRASWSENGHPPGPRRSVKALTVRLSPPGRRRPGRPPTVVV